MIRVSLSKHKRKAKTGKTYMYWYLRWFSSDGTQRGHSVGRVDGPNKLSKRQAELLRSRKEQELNEHPGRCDVSRAPVLSEFLETYLASRVDDKLAQKLAQKPENKRVDKEVQNRIDLLQKKIRAVLRA